MAGVAFDFRGNDVLATGGTSGIGLGVARAFAEAGARVIVTGRRGSASEYDEDLAGFDYRRAEMMDRASLAALVASLERLDVLVNNAGGNFMDRGEWNPEVFADRDDAQRGQRARERRRAGPHRVADDRGDEAARDGRGREGRARPRADGRWGTPEDVALVFLFLASPAARFVTGQIWCVDGGYSAQ